MRTLALWAGVACILAGTLLAAVVVRSVIDLATLNPTLGIAFVGAGIFGAGVVVAGIFAVLLMAVDAFGDGAAAFGATLGQSHRGTLDIVDAAAKSIETAGRVQANLPRPAPPPMIYTNGTNGSAGGDELLETWPGGE